MIKATLIYLIKKTKFYKLNFSFKKINLVNNFYNYNFQIIYFENLEYLKKVFFSKKYFNQKSYEEKSVHYHSFDWLNAAKEIGGAESISLSKKHIFNWLEKKYSKTSFVWNKIYTSKRLINIIYNYDFIATSSNEKEKKILNKLINDHLKIVSIYFIIENKEDLPIELIKILLLLNLIYKKNTEKIIHSIIKHINNSIDLFGFHKSNNPSYQSEFINHLYEIKNICLFFEKKVPNEINIQLVNMSSVLMNLFHKDNSIALFNGSTNANYKKIIKIFDLFKDLRPKKLNQINNGIAVYDDKSKKIFFDIVKPTNKKINTNLHASTLSFELSCDNEKVITNCGSVEKRFGKKPEYLRYSAAHSTIVLDNTNISELVSKKAYKRIPNNIFFNFQENDNYIFWTASHDGYKSNYNKIIKRKIMISKKKQEIFGEDSIISFKSNNRKTLFNIRFHLMPRCSCLVTNDHKSILIKTKLNNSWIFKSSSGLKVEDSIFVNDGKIIEQTKQIVITGYAEKGIKNENWSLKKIKQ